MFPIKSSQSTSVNELIFIDKIKNKPFKTSYHICFSLLQWPGINKKMQCSKQLCSSAFLYRQLLVNCDLIQAEIREATDGCEIRSCFDRQTWTQCRKEVTTLLIVWLCDCLVPVYMNPQCFGEDMQNLRWSGGARS